MSLHLYAQPECVPVLDTTYVIENDSLVESIGVERTNNLRLELTQYPPATYLLTLETETEVYSRKFTKCSY